jgi:hypothetical protein
VSHGAITRFFSQGNNMGSPAWRKSLAESIEIRLAEMVLQESDIILPLKPFERRNEERKGVFGVQDSVNAAALVARKV